MKKDEEKKNGHVHRKDKKNAVVRRVTKSIGKVGSCSIPDALEVKDSDFPRYLVPTTSSKPVCLNTSPGTVIRVVNLVNKVAGEPRIGHQPSHLKVPNLTLSGEGRPTTVRCVIDTGADTSIVSNNCFEEYGWSKKLIERVKTEPDNGISIETLGFVTLPAKESITPIQVIVATGMTDHVILRKDELIQNNWVVELIVTIASSGNYFMVDGKGLVPTLNHDSRLQMLSTPDSLEDFEFIVNEKCKTETLFPESGIRERLRDLVQLHSGSVLGQQEQAAVKNTAKRLRKKLHLRRRHSTVQRLRKRVYCWTGNGFIVARGLHLPLWWTTAKR